ncbi:glycoside hydrolase family 1 protein [Salmonella enterica subsp. enterica serovar Panama]|nr:glycoside hydrolase family 1 protein [Salmonella enterica subsp. enterica serovar Panama]
MRYRFPDNFWWGSACSALQTEGDSLNGGKSQTTWDVWFERQPGRFHQGIGPAETSTFYRHWKQDIALLKQLKHNSFRTSLSWARLIPDGVGEVNPQAVSFYNHVIDELLAQGITPFITLFHFDMPMVMQEKGGYLYDFHYPNVVDFKRAATVAYHTVLAHSTAVRAWRAGRYDGEIGVVLNLTPSYPRSQHPADVQAAHHADLLFNRSFLDPVLKGEYPADLVALLKTYDQLPACQPGDRQLITDGKIDLLGINYYQPRRVKCRDTAVNPQAPFMPEWLFDYYDMPGRKMNPYRGWEIYAPGIYDIITNLRDNYGNPRCFISENGMGVENEQRFVQAGQIHDDYRIDFISEHLKWLHKGISEGCHCLGYHMWTFIDNWSWLNGYKNRYGFVQLDLATQTRTVKKSGEWFAATAEHNGFD